MKKINVTLKNKELLYDISVVAYTVGDVMPEENSSARYKVQAVMDEENIRKVNMLIHSSWTDIVTALTAYIWTEHTEEINVSDKQVIPELYTTTLNVPDSIPEESAETLTRHAHDYIVNNAISQWFMMTKKDEAELYATLASNEMIQLKRVINLRKHPSRVHGWKL